jgi:hypothetical protein
MTALAPTLQAFFTDRLARQRHASPETVAAYRDALRLLVCFASQQVRKPPSELGIDDLDVTLIASFLDHWAAEPRPGRAACASSTAKCMERWTWSIWSPRLATSSGSRTSRVRACVPRVRCNTRCSTSLGRARSSISMVRNPAGCSAK